MKRLLIVAAIAVIVAPVLADPDVRPVGEWRSITYDMATGTITPGSPRMGVSIWAANQRSGYYWGGQMRDYFPGGTTLDFGDIATVPGVGVDVGGIRFSYATEIPMPQTVDVIIEYYAEENGRNSTGRVYLVGYIIEDLPMDIDPNDTFGTGWTVTVDLEFPGNPGCFNINGSDLDGDQLTDFGYTYFFEDFGGAPGPLGPVMAGDPNVVPPTAPGIEDRFDLFNDPNLVSYVGSFYFGGNPFAQFYMELFSCAQNQPTTDCPNPGKPAPRDWYCTADISGVTGQDCIVGLSDLAQLLANYGMTAGATHLMGDVHPEDHDGIWEATDGDGDIDIADLGQLLGQYGDNCN